MGFAFSHDINKLKNDIKQQSKKLDRIYENNKQKTVASFIRKQNKGNIDTTPVYYDLYNFTGVTYATGTTSPVPASAYISTLISGTTYSYSFKYPTYGFVVPHGETPESVTDGATPWEFQTTIAVVISKTQIDNMPEVAFDGMKVISYLYDEDGSTVEDLEFIYLEAGQNLDKQSVEYANFHKWVQLENNTGYESQYYAIYPVPENQQLTLVANIYMYNSKSDIYSQQIKL